MRSCKGWKGVRRTAVSQKRGTFHLQDGVFNYDMQKPLEENDQLVSNTPQGVGGRNVVVTLPHPGPEQTGHLLSLRLTRMPAWQLSLAWLSSFPRVGGGLPCAHCPLHTQDRA